MTEQLTQSEMDDLSAWLDGELPDRPAAAVSAKVARDPAWAAHARQLRRLDDLLDIWQVPPLRADLTPAVLAGTRKRPALPAWFHTLAPLAAAAAILVIVWLFNAASGPSLPAEPAAPLADAPMTEPPAASDFDVQVERLLVGVSEEDRQVVQNLDILQDFDVLVAFDTLQALDRLDSRSRGEADGI